VTLQDGVLKSNYRLLRQPRHVRADEDSGACRHALAADGDVVPMCRQPSHSVEVHHLGFLGSPSPSPRTFVVPHHHMLQRRLIFHIHPHKNTQRPTGDDGRQPAGGQQHTIFSRNFCDF
jgi:hypothetical protein